MMPRSFRDTLLALAQHVANNPADPTDPAERTELMNALRRFERVHTEFVETAGTCVLIETTPGLVTAQRVSRERQQAYGLLRQLTDKGDTFLVYVTSAIPNADDPVTSRVTLKLWSVNSRGYPTPRTGAAAEVLSGDLGAHLDGDTLTLPAARSALDATSDLRDRLRRLVHGNFELYEMN
ncbi:hypothetical protein [Deinococcus soli (ex Cha et al. 2016)]|uniref:Uncharacterized protein n=2 Tax=Deinococcus soli (ex Cha et al. 2016) TaxID=1309411 RepID=A0ACC6KKM2_9DEIO|nr:hypothetical protein [Deinococcus soli (ex Cha et al. 2016)]MDR6218672.1 hypothetical protein [Deinococcus soli (ex Cha et al. 2016)]MDR6328469.1 hypothetical protein [Deinococcus soli (ex Cha et al. 2016)]MDR6753080.1 hypothetical protein [Deinococcus soli (ex Cha et al. 2016)]